MEYSSEDLIKIFNAEFKDSEQTVLVLSAGEPLYMPMGEGRRYHEIRFAYGYFASALHEIAHWCIAGKHRRTLEDFGYWYEPDGRSPQQQAEFEKVEVQPQALEWLFNLACGSRFRLSADNLNGTVGCSQQFRRRVFVQAGRYLQSGIPECADRFIHALSEFYEGAPVQRKDLCYRDL